MTGDEAGVRSCGMLGIVLSWNVDFMLGVTRFDRF